MDKAEFHSCTFRLLVLLVALGEAELISEIPPMKATMRQGFTMWSKVCLSSPHSHHAVFLTRHLCTRCHPRPQCRVLVRLMVVYSSRGRSDAVDGGLLESRKV